ncbi:hypothetical protein K461DRAFT_273278 [Myriangium duriaei CBS 260.36]|uniref:SMODS and SLOG-associating 2TM effector domain-containing protein n=1 Tax=Myriangium duriaei CBS 260.36 TaxID=1168546 RepID=A0A9P4JBP4_9PEZI|nr:hypothetical protein K461DRAFT_273278 [Myriangium duriaei CBS 260.36]
MAPKPDERTPMLQFPGMANPSPSTIHASNYHLQFCSMVGIPPMSHPSLPPDVIKTLPKPSKDLLYQRAIRRRKTQSRTYMFTASLANSLLLSQVVLGATVTALGASDSSRILITLFGALNTVIAGLVAYLKSRGQPMRARMYSEDLDRLVDEIENSAAMWLGISADIHGYSAIDTEDRVTVRGEVARLTRMWDAAIRRNVANDPDMYASGTPNNGDTEALRSRNGRGTVQLPVVVPTAPPAPTPAPIAAPSPLPTPVPMPSPSAAPEAPQKSAETVQPAAPEPEARPTPETPAAPAKPADPEQHNQGSPPATAPPEEKKQANDAASEATPRDSASSSGTTTLAPPQPEAAVDEDASPASAPLAQVSSSLKRHGSEAKANEGMKRSGSNAG